MRMPPHKCVAEGPVQKRDTVIKGRHLCASDHVSAGDRILQEEAAAAVLYDDCAANHCHMSFQIVQSLLRCGGCKFARYASRDSQRLAWQLHHREECAALQACNPNMPPPTVRLVAQLFWRRGRLKLHESAHTDVHDIDSLEHHWSDLPDSKKQLYAQMAALTRRYMQGKKSDEAGLPDPKSIALMLARCACNNHTICDDELRPIGVGLFSTGALINHSCTPNAMQSFSQQRVTFTALQPITPGKEITISYIELAATRAERRRQLLDQYYFDIDHGLQGIQAEPFLQCQSESILAEAFQSAPGHMDPADHDLSALQLTSAGGSVEAHLMAFSKAPQEEGQQDTSFPCSRDVELQEEGEGPASSSSSSSRQVLRAAIWASSRDPSGSGGPKQELVHTQCWGQGLAGVSEQQLLAMGRHMLQLLSQHSQCLAALESHRPAEAKALAESALHQADCLPHPAKALGPQHIWRLRLSEALMRSCIDLGNCWLQALSVGQLLVPVYEMVYPKVWPNKGLHFAMLAKIAAFLERDATAAQYAGEALQQLQYTHANSPVLEEIRQIGFEASRSQTSLYGLPEM